ncbi:MAG TPA: hypothetical protein PKZ22_12895 [Accumulibacter sp.]|jgi:outer membrane protein OmpA-like peptidoglycan-associated protein|nr:hypothetical protein [Accumulibacter sp.]
MVQSIVRLVKENYRQVDVEPFTSEYVSTLPLLMIGTLTPINLQGVADGERDAYRICFALADFKTGIFVAKGLARSLSADVDPTPLAFFREMPVWSKDTAVDGHVKTCQGTKAGDLINPAYIDAVLAASTVSEALAAYKEKRHVDALALYQSVLKNPAGTQARVLAGIYLANQKLGRKPAAMQAFGRLVDMGLATDRLAVRFSFKPGATAFGLDQPPYSQWLAEIGRQASRLNSCVEVAGHTPRGPSEQMDERLSLQRAEFIRQKIAASNLLYSDNTARWYRTQDGGEQLALFPHADSRRWVLWTPEGYFAASPGGENLVGWRIDHGSEQAADFFPVSRFRADSYVPETISGITGQGAMQKAPVATARPPAGQAIRERLPPTVRIVSPDTASLTPGNDKTLQLWVAVRSPTDAPVTKLKARINGQPVALPALSSLRGSRAAGQNEAVYEVPVVLPAIDAQILLFAENRYGLSPEAVLTVKRPAKAPDNATGDGTTTGRQYAQESSDWGNGAFTKAILEGLRGQADYNKSGRITHEMLDLYVSERVKGLTEGAQSPVTIVPGGVPDFALVLGKRQGS